LKKCYEYRERDGQDRSHEPSLLFYSEDGDSIFLQNDSKRLPHYTVSHPRRKYSSVLLLIYLKTYEYKAYKFITSIIKFSVL
jgi:hypothetical protein